MTDPVQTVLWTEKHRPTSLAGLALDSDARALLTAYLAAEEIPHLLLIGPPGTGKTTLARIICASLDCRVLALNASVERGIDVVREKIGAFVTAAFGFKYNIVFMDEADATTADSQTALRNLMETYSERSRFLLTANYGHRIISPIQSRCQVVTIGAPPLKERFRVLSEVLQREGIAADPQAIFSYAERYVDMRRLLWAAQQGAMVLGNKTLPPATTGPRAQGAELLTAVEQKNWTVVKQACAANDFDPQQALRDLFWAVPDDHRRVGFLRHVIGRGVHETGFTPDPAILFLAVAAEAMEGL